eukprot:gene14534-biopygen12643
MGTATQLCLAWEGGAWGLHLVSVRGIRCRLAPPLRRRSAAGSQPKKKHSLVRGAPRNVAATVSPFGWAAARIIAWWLGSSSHHRTPHPFPVGVSNMCAAMVTNPIDVVKTRMQMTGMEGGRTPFRTACLDKDVINENCSAGLFN